MGNLVRKPVQLFYNTIDANTITYSATNPLAIANWNQIAQTDEVVKFKKSSYAAGTAMVDTVTPVIAYPASAQVGAEIFVNIKTKPELTARLGAGRADSFKLHDISFHGSLDSLAAANAGYLADADYTLLLNQVRAAINTHEYFKDKVTASGTTTLILTSADANYGFEVTVAAKYGSIAHTTPGVYPTLPADQVFRIFAIKKYDAGQGLDMFPAGDVTDWTQYYFRIKRGGYALDGANHQDSVYEEAVFFLPTAIAEGDHTTEGAWWDEKIFDFLTEIGYVDPHGDTTPWGLVEGATS